MKQHWLDSLLEALTNTGVGFLISLGAQLAFAHLVGIQMSFGQNVQLVLFMTVVSIIRQYMLRRLFNGRTVWQALKGRFNDHG